MRPRYDVAHLREAERVEDLCLEDVPVGAGVPFGPLDELPVRPKVPPLQQENQEADKDRRRLSVFSASARRKRAAGHLRQVEKKHSHDPHPGVTGQLEYDHPVSYAVAVAKKHAEEAAAPALQLRDGRV